jgi:eukaryotic-like serine/threonine-protein kinase
MPLTAGERLGPYEVLALIGAGGMGEVWKARDTRLDRVVAIKVSQEKFSDRFEREARAVAALNHPHICTLHDVGPNYLVMEYVEGAPLKGPLPLEKAVEYADQILDALDAAHQKGIIHRDLKPANILITKQGIKLLDFGLAKQAAPLKNVDVTRALTDQGQILGTLQYMSPEQLQGKEADARSDLFAFGCVLYEMLSGRRAFEGSSGASVIAAILEREPAPLAQSTGDTGRLLDRVSKRSMAKDPDQRFQTARDLKAALSWVLDQPSLIMLKPSRRIWIGIAAALALGAIGGGLTVSRLRRPSPEQGVLRVQINPPEGGQFAFGIGIGGVALSPEGRTAAFVATANGKTGLWVRPLDGTAARLIPGTEGAMSPFWSPDSKSIAFFTASKLQSIDLADGTPLVICDANRGYGGAWTPDGQIIFGMLGFGLRRVSASGGTHSAFTTLDASHGETTHSWPQALPKGRFLFFAIGDNLENTGVYAASLAKPNERVHLLRTDSKALYASGSDGRDYLVWQHSGTLVAQEFDTGALRLTGEVHTLADHVAVITGGTGGLMNAAVSGKFLLYSHAGSVSQFTWFDRAGKRLGVVGEPGEYAPVRLSPNGRQVVSARRTPRGYDLWLLDADRGVASLFTSTPGFKGYPVWSPDGRTIAFGSGPPLNLFRKAAAGGDDEQRLIKSSHYQYPVDWSRDGHLLLYGEIGPGTGNDLWVLPVTPEGKVAPDAKPRPYLHTQFNERHGRFSPEPQPHWVAYTSDESGRPEVYVDAFPEARNKVLISTAGGEFPEWSPVGRELFYLSPGLKLMQVSLKLGTDSIEPSSPRELFALPIANDGYSSYEVAPDGQRFLVRATPEKQAGQPLTLIVNWPALMKKGAAAE